MNILLPWLDISEPHELGYYVRPSLIVNGVKFRSYYGHIHSIMPFPNDSVAYGISVYDTAWKRIYYGATAQYNTKEDAMKAADELLIAAGFRLLNENDPRLVLL